MLLTNGRIFYHREACTFIAKGPQSPDRQVESLLGLASDSIRRDLLRRGGTV